ncbi:MAG: carboxypeptidase-like regulatory domain-containing protein, partial [Acidobacteriota bacterium]|nr:carboxypeptidase-like regulatory domain-containing protein [Acidobacteriota bacterium]
MKRYLLAAGIFVAFGAHLVTAQTQAINGAIRGRVTDPGGAPIPAASVEAVSSDTGFARSFETPEDGYFVFPNLPLGTWSVTVKKAGFETLRSTGIVLNAGTQAEINAQLIVGQVSTSVEVTGTGLVLEPSRLETGRTISHDEVDNLPLTSRNPYNFIIFQPGVSGHPNAELGIPRTINTNGLLDRINYQMDGMVNTESDRYGLRLFPISDIYVREVQTVSNSFAPEFGGTSGNIFNVITNSGSNRPHSEFYYIGRPVDANARPTLLALSQPKPNLTLTDLAVNGGGAIIKDKLFIFGGYEHLTRGLPAPNTIDPNQAAQIGIAPALLATAPAVQHAQFLNFRLDWIISQKHQAFIRYNYFRNEYPFNTAVGGKNALDVASDFRDRAHIVGFQLLSTFTPTILNELRASDPYRNEAHVADPLTSTGVQVVISGIATFNGTSAIGDHFAEKIPSVSDNLTWISGGHTWKAGYGFQAINDNQVGNVFSRYTFSDIASYLAAKSGVNPKSYSTY